MIFSIFNKKTIKYIKNINNHLKNSLHFSHQDIIPPNLLIHVNVTLINRKLMIIILIVDIFIFAIECKYTHPII